MRPDWLSRRLALVIFVTASAALPVGCTIGGIPVEDENGYWKKAIVDEKLAGRWFVDETDQIVFTQKDDQYYISAISKDRETGRRDAVTVVHAKTLIVGKQRLLMYRLGMAETGNPEADKPREKMKEVALCRYDVTETRLTVYMPKSEVLLKLTGDDRWKDVIVKREREPNGDRAPGDRGPLEEAVLPQLNERTLVFLEWFTREEKNWDADSVMRLTRTPPKKPDE